MRAYTHVVSHIDSCNQKIVAGAGEVDQVALMELAGAYTNTVVTTIPNDCSASEIRQGWIAP